MKKLKLIIALASIAIMSTGLMACTDNKDTKTDTTNSEVISNKTPDADTNVKEVKEDTSKKTKALNEEVDINKSTNSEKITNTELDVNRTTNTEKATNTERNINKSTNTERASNTERNANSAINSEKASNSEKSIDIGNIEVRVDSDGRI